MEHDSPKQPDRSVPTPAMIAGRLLPKAPSLLDYDRATHSNPETKVADKATDIAWHTARAIQKHPEATELPLLELPAGFHEIVDTLLKTGQRIWHIRNVIESVFSQPTVHPYTFALVRYELDELVRSGVLINLGKGKFCHTTRDKEKPTIPTSVEQTSLDKKLSDAGIRTLGAIRRSSSVNKYDARTGAKTLRRRR